MLSMRKPKKDMVKRRSAKKNNHTNLIVKRKLFLIIQKYNSWIEDTKQKVSSSNEREFGYANAKMEANSRLLEGVETHDEQPVWMSHGDRVESLPEGFRTICTSANSPSAAMA